MCSRWVASRTVTSKPSGQPRPAQNGPRSASRALSDRVCRQRARPPFASRTSSSSFTLGITMQTASRWGPVWSDGRAPRASVAPVSSLVTGPPMSDQGTPRARAPGARREPGRMDLRDSVAVVTGSNRGLGRHLTMQLLERGAGKVYATARTPDAPPGATPLHLDVTAAASIAEAAAVATDATILINNAGISTGARLIDGDLALIELEMKTHFFGALGVTRAFAPILAANGGGAILNVLSVLSWLHAPDFGAYSAAKAAAWAMTDVLRQELAADGIAVTALHIGFMDTDMGAGAPPDRKADPAQVAALALDGIEASRAEVLADDLSRRVREGLAAPPAPPTVAA